MQRPAASTPVTFAINTVALRGLNEDELPELIAWAHGEQHNIGACRPIRLADVLLAMREVKRYSLTVLTLLTIADNRRWNLRADDLEHQSDETISFIHSLLK